METVTLVVGLAATALVIFWITKKLFKLALYAGVVGVVAWFWYSQVG